MSNFVPPIFVNIEVKSSTPVEEGDPVADGVAGTNQVTISLSSHLSQSNNNSSFFSLAKTPINQTVLKKKN